jgi:hypothetical protein
VNSLSGLAKKPRVTLGPGNIQRFGSVIQTVTAARREGVKEKRQTTKTSKTSKGQALLPPLQRRQKRLLFHSSGRAFFEVFEVFVVRFSWQCLNRKFWMAKLARTPGGWVMIGVY